MASASQTARAKFQETAAYTYAVRSPATSAYLMLHRNFETTLSVKPSRDDSSIPSCRACGTIFLPGWTSKTSISNQSSVRKGPPSSKKEAGKARQGKRKVLKVECLKCHRYVQTSLDSLKLVRKPAVVEHPASATRMTTTDVTRVMTKSEKQKPTVGNGGRQRAKARRGGLQAMLEKSKQTSTSSFGSGLDLMDFMR